MSALVLAAAAALAKSLTLKFFYVMGKALSDELNVPVTGLVKSYSSHKISCSNIFCQKIVMSSCIAKVSHIFSAKNSRVFTCYTFENLMYH